MCWHVGLIQNAANFLDKQTLKLDNSLIAYWNVDILSKPNPKAMTNLLQKSSSSALQTDYMYIVLYYIVTKCVYLATPQAT